MNAEDIRRVLIIGAGTMGLEIGLQCARYGCDVVMYDAAPAALESAAARQQAILAHLVGEGQLSEAEARAIVGRISSTTDPGLAARDVDLVSESVPEDPELKGRVLAQFHPLCPPRTIFTTNTSTLLPSMFAGATGRPEQFAAFHFHHWVWLSNVVDIMPHPGTAPEVVDLLTAFARRINQIPIICRTEHTGYVFNSMLSALNGAALGLVSGGIASPEDVDRAWMGVMKTPIGPFGIMDSIGLDTAWHITEYWAGVTGDPQLRRNANLLKGYVDRGDLGLKSGRGFYTYPDPAFQQPGFLIGE